MPDGPWLEFSTYQSVVSPKWKVSKIFVLALPSWPKVEGFFCHYFSLFSSGKPDGQGGSRNNTFQLVPYVPLTATSRQPRHRGSQLCRAADGRALPAARMVAVVGWEHELWQFWIQHNSPPPSRVMKSQGRSCEFEVVFSLRLFLGQRCTGIWG